MAPRYTSEAEIKLDLRAPTSPNARSWNDNTFDATIRSCIEAAERAIDSHCGWSFDPAPTDAVAVTVAHYHPSFPPRNMSSWVETGPSATAAATITAAGTTVPDTQWRWETEPAFTGDAWRNLWFDCWAPAPIIVTARWGWPDIPDAVKLAARRWTVHLFKQLSTPLGAELLGEEVVRISNIPAGVKSLLEPYAKQGTAYVA